LSHLVHFQFSILLFWLFCSFLSVSLIFFFSFLFCFKIYFQIYFILSFHCFSLCTKIHKKLEHYFLLNRIDLKKTIAQTACINVTFSLSLIYFLFREHQLHLWIILLLSRISFAP
jgi:hypothetical protein